MNILFRVDGNSEIGLGHVQRVLNLMKSFGKSAETTVMLRRQDEASARIFERENSRICFLDGSGEETEVGGLAKAAKEAKPDAIVVDRVNDSFDPPGAAPHRYSYSDSYFSSLREMVRIPIAALDDCGRKRIDADAVINGTVVSEWQRYPESGVSRLFLGPRYTILDGDYAGYNARRRAISRVAETVTVTTGGSDPSEMTISLSSMLLSLDFIKKVNIVVGPYFGDGTIRRLEAAVESDQRISLLRNKPKLAEEFYQSDIVVLTAGQTAYECACLGTPFVAVNRAHHQKYTSSAFARLDACEDFGMFGELDKTAFLQNMESLSKDRERRSRMSEAGKKVVDGKGAERAREIITGLTHER